MIINPINQPTGLGWVRDDWARGLGCDRPVAEQGDTGCQPILDALQGVHERAHFVEVHATALASPFSVILSSNAQKSCRSLAPLWQKNLLHTGVVWDINPATARTREVGEAVGIGLNLHGRGHHGEWRLQGIQLAHRDTGEYEL